MCAYMPWRQATSNPQNIFFTVWRKESTLNKIMCALRLRIADGEFVGGSQDACGKPPHGRHIRTSSSGDFCPLQFLVAVGGHFAKGKNNELCLGEPGIKKKNSVGPLLRNDFARNQVSTCLQPWLLSLRKLFSVDRSPLIFKCSVQSHFRQGKITKFWGLPEMRVSCEQPGTICMGNYMSCMFHR